MSSGSYDKHGPKQLTRVTTATTAVIKATTGELHSIIIHGGTLTGTITIYDWDSVSNLPTAKFVIAATQILGQQFHYGGVLFSSGIVITTSAAVDLVVTYR